MRDVREEWRKYEAEREGGRRGNEVPGGECWRENRDRWRGERQARSTKYEVDKLGATGLRRSVERGQDRKEAQGINLRSRGVEAILVSGACVRRVGISIAVTLRNFIEAGVIRGGTVWGILVVMLLVLGMLGGGLRAEGDTEKPTCLALEMLKEKMPDEAANAKRDGCCYLMRWKGCRIIAVVCSYGSEHIPLLFVNADKREDAIKAANELAKMIPCSRTTRPFDKREPWVAIICPCLSESQRYTPNVLLYPDGGKYTRFIGWQGKLLRAQLVYDSEFGKSKKRGTVIEIVLDITQPRCSHGEFRPQKGRLEDDEIKEFICSRMTGVSSYLPELNGRDRKEIRGKFPGAEVLAYSAVTNSCIVRKGRTYHAGAIDQVSEYVTSARSIASFEYPEGEVEKPTIGGEQEDTGLAENRQTPEGATKSEVVRDDGDSEWGINSGSSERAEEGHTDDGVVETPPKTVREALDNYIRLLNEM